MQAQRDAILGYAEQQHAYYIRFIEDHQVIGGSYTLLSDAEDAEKIMTLLYLKKTFWLNGSTFQDVIKGLQILAVHSS